MAPKTTSTDTTTTAKSTVIAAPNKTNTKRKNMAPKTVSTTAHSKLVAQSKVVVVEAPDNARKNAPTTASAIGVSETAPTNAVAMNVNDSARWNHKETVVIDDSPGTNNNDKDVKCITIEIDDNDNIPTDKGYLIGEDMEASVELKRRIEEFKKLPVHKDLKFGEKYHKPRKVSTSILDKCGVRVSNPEKNSYFFRCLVGKCYAVDKTCIRITKTSTFHATAHIKLVHQTVSAKTEATTKNIEALQNMLEISDAVFAKNPERFFQTNIAAWQAEHCIPFNAFENRRWKVISKKLPVPGGEGLTELPLRRLLIEHYVTVKNKIVLGIKDARNQYDLPYLSMSLDLITGKTNNKKYIGLRVSWVDRGCMFSRNLAVREYTATLDDRKKDAASTMLVAWMDHILREFSISREKDLLTSSSDSGSDVKKALGSVAVTMREWCLSHITNLCLVEAFGSGKSANNCKNTEARKTFKIIKKFIERVNKSGDLKAAFDEEVSSQFGRKLKLMKNSPQHRWGAVEESIRGLLKSWDAITIATNRVGETFPVEDKKRLLVEWYSVLQQPRQIQKKAQAMNTFVIPELYIMLAKMFITLLVPTAPFTLHDPSIAKSLDKAKKQDTVEVVDAGELHSSTTTVRGLLREAYMMRFFNRYHPMNALYKPSHFYCYSANTDFSSAVKTDFRFSYLMDMQAVFCPNLRDMELVKVMINKIDIPVETIPNGWTLSRLRLSFFHMLETYIWKTIKNLAYTVAVARVSRMEEPEPSDSGHIVKRRRVDKFVQNNAISMLNDILGRSSMESLDDGERDPSYVERDPKKIVDLECKQYFAIHESKFPEPAELLKWWHAQRLEMPCLSQVAGALLACKPGSGGLECDFGALGDILTGKRSTLSSGYVEATMMLKINKDFVTTNSNDIVLLGKDEWQKHVPSRPDFNLGTTDDNDDNVDSSDMENEQEDDTELTQSFEE